MKREAQFRYDPIAHTDQGLIFCDEPVAFAARVTVSDYGNRFTIRYDGEKTPEISRLLKLMEEWFYLTHIKDSGDNEF